MRAISGRQAYIALGKQGGKYEENSQSDDGVNTDDECTDDSTIIGKGRF
ncbi:MAG: hypothetical protein GY865_14345 [candidate division Zixibacteria bacterium]|nr:hypothetical protein [candidate division Zixibacteria bacterium]